MDYTVLLNCAVLAAVGFTLAPIEFVFFKFGFKTLPWEMETKCVFFSRRILYASIFVWVSIFALAVADVRLAVILFCIKIRIQERAMQLIDKTEELAKKKMDKYRSA